MKRDKKEKVLLPGTAEECFQWMKEHLWITRHKHFSVWLRQAI